MTSSSSSSPPRRPNPPWQRQIDGVELAVEREVADVGSRNSTGRSPASRPRGEREEVGRQVDADDLDAPPRQRERVPARTAARVEHRIPGSSSERVDEEVDLLHGSDRERVP